MSSNRGLYKPNNIVAVIPVGGYANRLRPITDGYSKATIRFMNQPLIENQLLGLAELGVREIIFGVKGCDNYTDIHDRYGSGAGFSAYGIPDLSLKYQTQEDVGSADSVRVNIEYYEIGDRPVFVAQCDNIFDTADLPELIKRHEEREAFMTIGLTHVDNVEGYGVAELDAEQRIRRFVERPKGEAASHLINTGLYLFSPEIRKLFDDEEVKKMIQGGRLDFGLDMIPYMIKKGLPVYGHIMKSYWHDVGTVPRYIGALHDMLNRGHSNRRPGKEICPEVFVGGVSRSSSRGRQDLEEKFKKDKLILERPVIIGKHCQIGDGVRIARSCVDDYVKIGEGSVIEDSAVMDGTIIGESAEIKYSIIGRCAKINSSEARPTKINSYSAIGNATTCEAGCEIISTKVKPRSVLPAGSYVNKDPYKE